MAKPVSKNDVSPRLVLYARVSTPDQSVAQQRELMLRYVEEQQKRGVFPLAAVVMHHDDIGVSGSVPFFNRPSGKVAIDSLTRGDHMICTKLDRAFRSASDCLATAELLDKRGVKVHLLNLRVGEDACINSGMGKFMMTVLAAVAEVERQMISERTRDQKRARKAQGFHVGGHVPWRQEKSEDGRLSVSPAKELLVVRMREWRSQSIPLREIQGRITKQGHSISLTTIRALTNTFASPLGKKRGRRKAVGKSFRVPVQKLSVTRPPAPPSDLAEAASRMHKAR